ncbi:MAG: hypothetical protein QOD75_3798 [Blastocatellia bacterium]|nr:hypothetical protein [Blastocatellia bacterium]
MHEAPSANGAVILASGAYGGIDGPSDIYGEVARRLNASGITCVRVDYQKLHEVAACVGDVTAAIENLKAEGINRVVLVGWSFGGAVVANAAVENENVVGVALIASQLAGAEVVAQLSPRQRLLLIHGLHDSILPGAYSQQLYEVAECPKELRFMAADHFFSGHEAALTDQLIEWCCSFFPRYSIPPTNTP